MTVPFTLGASRLPLFITPGAVKDTASLSKWLADHPEWIRDTLRENGALLFRGFDVRNVDDVETVARAIEPGLQNEYLGSSPRVALSKSGYVFSASELPDFYPLPAHNEMSFTANPPSRIFFSCTIEPRQYGETPLVDFRKVYQDLDPELRERWASKGLRIIRNYSGPDETKKDFFELKKWTEMFRTRDRAEVERVCARENFTAVWKDNDRLALICDQKPIRPHPITGEPVWFNHIHNFHLDAGHLEYFQVLKYRPTLRNLKWWLLARALSAWKHLTVADNDQAMHSTFADGSPIPADDVRQVIRAIWKNIVITPWRKGDIVVIDNAAVGHGRLPYEGPREVVVAWA
jgi:alpha-ketoglutarate-dependent taurine dioxygenase